MSQPRPVVPGRCYLLTRRCSERRFLMRPDRETVNAWIYCLALAAQRHGLDVVAVGACANHHHVVAVDRRGELPAFLQYFHRLFAAHQNALRGRWEAFWCATEQTSAVELVDPDAVVDKAVYAIVNPVKDFIVDRVHHWPGPDALTAIVEGVPLVASKPGRFFRPDGELPDTVSLPFVRPPGLEHLSQHEYAELLRARVVQAEAQARAERIGRGIRVLGRKAVLRQHWNDRPASREPRRQLSPRLACRDKWRRIESLQRNKRWLHAYRAARARWLAGEPEVAFPPGTWWLARHAAVTCELAAPS
jgi:hypothetical protein